MFVFWSGPLDCQLWPCSQPFPSCHQCLKQCKRRWQWCHAKCHTKQSQMEPALDLSACKKKYVKENSQISDCVWACDFSIMSHFFLPDHFSFWSANVQTWKLRQITQFVLKRRGGWTWWTMRLLCTYCCFGFSDRSMRPLLIFLFNFYSYCKHRFWK